MKRNTVIVIAVCFLPMCLSALSQQRGTGELHPSNASVAEPAAEKKILAVLDEMVKAHETYLSVPVKDGRALRLLMKRLAPSTWSRSARPRDIRASGFVWLC